VRNIGTISRFQARLATSKEFAADGGAIVVNPADMATCFDVQRCAAVARAPSHYSCSLVSLIGGKTYPAADGLCEVLGNILVCGFYDDLTAMETTGSTCLTVELSHEGQPIFLISRILAVRSSPYPTSL
jgi:hypothetical protein